MIAPHEFDEDVDDGSMCMCGIPALTHDAVVPLPQPTLPGEQDEPGLPALTGALSPAEAVSDVSRRRDTCPHKCPCTSDMECTHDCSCQEDA